MVKCFHFMGKKDDSNSGGATIAYEIIDGDVYYGIAVCSEKDQFAKSLGRHIAEQRLLKNPLVLEKDIIQISRPFIGILNKDSAEDLLSQLDFSHMSQSYIRNLFEIILFED